MPDRTRWPLSRKQTVALLRRWNVGEFLFLREVSGSASPAVVVVTRRGQYFLKQRSPRYSERPRLSYDHSLMRYLARAGFPVVPALKTYDGSRWVVAGGHVYEIYPWVQGRAFDPESPADLVAAADLLARLHQATADFTPTGRKELPRLFHPADRLAEIAEARALLDEGVSAGEFSTSEARGVLDQLEQTAREVLRRVPDERYWALPQAIIHGDYHPANVRYRRPGEIVGLFDWDWACRQARVKDVADGILFFACPRERPLAGDLTALAQAPRYDGERIRLFLETYQACVPVSEEEIACLPDMLRERWLYVRLDAMHRKVARENKLRFLLPEVTEPLKWIDALPSCLCRD